MSEQIYVQCEIITENSAIRQVKSTLFDGTKFEIAAPYWSVLPVENSPTKAAWLLVEVLGRDEKNSKISVKLPAPSLTLGHIVSISAKNAIQVTHGKLEKMENSSRELSGSSESGN